MDEENVSYIQKNKNIMFFFFKINKAHVEYFPTKV